MSRHTTAEAVGWQSELKIVTGPDLSSRYALLVRRSSDRLLEETHTPLPHGRGSVTTHPLPDGRGSETEVAAQQRGRWSGTGCGAARVSKRSAIRLLPQAAMDQNH